MAPLARYIYWFWLRGEESIGLRYEVMYKGSQGSRVTLSTGRVVRARRRVVEWRGCGVVAPSLELFAFR